MKIINLRQQTKAMDKKLKKYNEQNEYLGFMVEDLRGRQEQIQSLIRKSKNIIRSNEQFINGFKNARDYYAKSSSKQFLSTIKKPTLLINALDDPFLSESCFPFTEAKNNPQLHLMCPSYGGHVGFVSKGETYWSEQQILNFIKLY